MSLDINKVYQGDCLELMKEIPDVSIDMVLCDLPYGSTQNRWDAIIPLDLLWKQYIRICKPTTVIVLTASQPFSSVLGMSNLDRLKYAWVWKKSSVTGHLNAHHMPMKTHEDILVFYSGKVIYNPQDLKPYQKIKRRGNNGNNFGISGTENYQEWTNYPRSILDFSNDSSKLHPTQKPLALFEYLIKTYTNEGMTILDNCAGSGTTGLAARNLHRNFILIEKEPEYVEVIKKRLGI